MRIMIFIIAAVFTNFTHAEDKLIPYKIIDKITLSNIKLSFDIEVPLMNGRLPNEKELSSISSHLVKSESTKYEKSFIAFYLPGMEINAGAYATAHHNPNIKVNIMPFMLMRYPEYQKLLE